MEMPYNNIIVVTMVVSYYGSVCPGRAVSVGVTYAI